MAKMLNRAKMSVTSTGTGTLTLGSAVLGFQTFANAGVANADTISYAIEDGTNWEIGTGTYTSSGTTLSRTVTRSYDGTTYGTSPISVTTSAQVFATALAADLVVTGGAAGTPSSITLTNGTGLPLTTGVTGTLPVANGGTGVTTSTGSGDNVLSTSPILVTPILGTPTSGNFSTGTFTWPTFNQNTTGTAAGLSATLAVASGGTGVTTSTGTGSVVLSTSPTLVTPVLGTPTSGNFSTGTFTWPTFNQNTTGTAAGLSATLAVTSGGTGVTTSTGTGSNVLSTSPTLVTPLLGTPSSGTLTNCTNIPVNQATGTLPVANGGTGITSFGTGVATWLGTPSSANLASAITDETGSGALVFGTSPTITTPTITGYTEFAPTVATSGTATTIVITAGTVLRFTMTGNCTFTMPSATTAGQSFIVILTQDGTGGRTAVFTSVKWPSGSAPTITTTATTGRDIITFVSDGTNWYGTAAQAFA